MKRLAVLSLILLLALCSCDKQPQEDAPSRPPVWEMTDEQASEILENDPQEQTSAPAPEPEPRPEKKDGSSAPEPSEQRQSLPSGYAKNDSARFVGKWSAPVDLFDIFDTDDEFIAANKMSGILVMEFDSDGYYKMYIDPDSAASAKQSISERYREYMLDTAANNMVQNGVTDESPEDYLRQHGYDLDSEVHKYVSGLDIDGIVADHDFEGRYDALDGKLMFSSGRQYAVSSKTYFIYTLKSGSRFDITGGTGGSEKRFLDAFYYPLEFTKQ